MNNNNILDKIKAVALDDENNTLIVLDQTVLPNEKIFLKLTNQNMIWEAIYSLKVRGAPAIGIAAAYGIYLTMKESREHTFEDILKEFKTKKDYLASARPTAVNLFWALNRMEKRLLQESDKSIPQIKEALKQEAIDIEKEDENMCKKIGENALSLLKSGMGILTHCNAGTIATAKYGTALSPIYLGKEKGIDFNVYACETRPLLQGARLTSWELKEFGINVTLICDNMASFIMKQNKIDAVLVGCDRVVANGDTANKIGTSGLSILARHYNIPFYVCGPSSTIDMNLETGDQIDIELRPGEEITSKWYEKRMAPEGINVYNPAFDVTDHSLITAIITEKGIIYPPYKENLKNIFK